MGKVWKSNARGPKFPFGTSEVISFYPIIPSMSGCCYQTRREPICLDRRETQFRLWAVRSYPKLHLFHRSERPAIYRINLQSQMIEPYHIMKPLQNGLFSKVKHAQPVPTSQQTVLRDLAIFLHPVYYQVVGSREDDCITKADQKAEQKRLAEHAEKNNLIDLLLVHCQEADSVLWSKKLKSHEAV